MNDNKVIIVAPTIEEGRIIANDFCIPARNVYSMPISLYGLSERVVLLAGGLRWNMEKFEEIRQALAPGNHTVIMVPEYILR